MRFLILIIVIMAVVSATLPNSAHKLLAVSISGILIPLWSSFVIFEKPWIATLVFGAGVFLLLPIYISSMMFLSWEHLLLVLCFIPLSHIFSFLMRRDMNSMLDDVIDAQEIHESQGDVGGLDVVKAERQEGSIAVVDGRRRINIKERG